MLKRRPEITNKELTDYFKKLAIEEKAKQDTLKEMFSNTDYIDWLIHFTISHPNFSSDSWLYFPNEIDPKDNENVDKLHLFFKGIDNYAQRNYIDSTPDSFGYYYSIRKGDACFNIGVAIGQGTLFYCERTLPQKTSIHFDDILNHTIFKRTKLIDRKLEQLAKIIKSLMECGVPMNAIEDKLETIKQEQNEKGTTLTKK